MMTIIRLPVVLVIGYDNEDENPSRIEPQDVQDLVQEHLREAMNDGLYRYGKTNLIEVEVE